MDPFPLTPQEEETIPAYKNTLKKFQKKLGLIINSNTSTADLLQLTRELTSNSYYFGFNFDHQDWLIRKYDQMEKMRSNPISFTEKYCAELLIEYSRLIPQLEPIDELSRTLPVLFHSITSSWGFNQKAIHICTQQYPQLRLCTTPLRHQEIQKVKNSLLAFLTTEITKVSSLTEITNHINQKVIWFSQFLQITGIVHLKASK